MASSLHQFPIPRPERSGFDSKPKKTRRAQSLFIIRFEFDRSTRWSGHAQASHKSPREALKRVDPRAIFEHARFHMQSRELLDRHTNVPEPFPFPLAFSFSSIVLASFSCEVFLKCIYAIENDGLLPGRDHELDKLFKLLSTKAQEEIKDEWDRTTQMDPGMKGLVELFRDEDQV
jgi:hypothetical protein